MENVMRASDNPSQTWIHFSFRQQITRKKPEDDAADAVLRDVPGPLNGILRRHRTETHLHLLYWASPPVFHVCPCADVLRILGLHVHIKGACMRT